ncbi:MAG: sigma-70 family RNA polymerase sigma factor [Planctomycetota bacterium]
MALGAHASHSDERLDAWIRRHQTATWRYARLCGCPADVADDLVQEALLAALHKQIPERADPLAAAWLRGAVNNLWRMHLRTNSRRTQRIDLALAETARRQCAGDDGGEAWLEALRACLQSLEQRTRNVLDLHYGKGASRESIATTLGMRPDGVKTFLRRVREALRQCVLRRTGVEQESLE